MGIGEKFLRNIKREKWSHVNYKIPEYKLSPWDHDVNLFLTPWNTQCPHSLPFLLTEVTWIICLGLTEGGMQIALEASR